MRPTRSPTAQPTALPTRSTAPPTFYPSTLRPTVQAGTTAAPIAPTVSPTRRPTVTPSSAPTSMPSAAPPELISLNATNIGKTSVDIVAVVSYDADVFCAWFPFGTELSSDIDDILGQQTSSLSYNATATVHLQGFDPDTALTVYCMAVSVIQTTNYALSMSLNITSGCCKVASFSLGAFTMPESSYKLSGATVVLSHLPSDSVTVQLQSACSIAGIVTYSISEFSFYSGSPYMSSSADIISGVPGNCTLGVSLIGTSRSEYSVTYTTSRAMEVYSTTAPPPAPVLSGAVFASDGGTIVLTFDTQTNKAGVQSLFSCESLLSFTGAATSRCQWTDTQHITIYPSSAVIPGVVITLLGNVLAAKCVSGTTSACSDFPRAPTAVTTISKSVTPILPTVAITNPSSVGSCSDVVLDLTNSFGSGGRPWKSTVFTVQTTPLDVNATALTYFLNNMYRISPPTSISADLLVPQTLYTITVRLCNFLDGCSSSSTRVAVEQSASAPVVTILGQPNRNVYARDGFSVVSKAVVATCNGTAPSPNLVYSWRVALLDLYGLTDVVSGSVSPSTFMVAPYVLQAGSWYSFRVTALDTLSGISATVKIRVNVLRGNLVAVIGGGSDKTARAGETLMVDGSRSYDQDWENLFGNELESVNYAWSCVGLLPTYSTVCPVVLSTLSGATTVVSNMTIINATFRVTLTMSDSTRSSTAFVNVLTTEALAPQLLISNVQSPVNSNLQLMLSATVWSAIPCTSEWTFSDSSVPLENVTLSPTVVTSPANSIVPVYLLLAANALQEGGFYTFTLSCRGAYASIDILMNSPPQYGTLSVTPSQGVELSTSFRFVTTGWYDGETPITYQFEFLSYSGLNMSLMNRAEQTYTSALLPAGYPDAEYNLTCRVRAYDSLDAFSLMSEDVTVSLAVSGTETILASQLANSASIGDVDGMKQLLSAGSSVINQINISQSLNCSQFHREASVSLGGSCGECLPGFIGEDAPSTAECLTPLSEVVHKTCVSCIGVCSMISLNTLLTVDSCLSNDTSCTSLCVCSFGYEGFENNCASNLDEIGGDVAIREALMTGLIDLTGSEDASQDTVKSWVEHLSALTQRSDPLSPAITTNGLDTALSAVTAARGQNIPPQWIDGLLKSVDSLATVVATTYYSQRLSGNNSSAAHLRRLIENAADLDTARSKTKEILSNFGILQMESMVVGQPPFVAVRKGFKMTSKVTNVDENQTVNIEIPRTKEEEAYDAPPATVNISTSGAGSRISTTAVETKVAHYGDSGANYTANPVRVQIVAEKSENATLQFNFPNIKIVDYTDTNDTAVNSTSFVTFTVSTTCLPGDFQSHVETCPNGTQIVHTCSGDAGIMTSTCPKERVSPFCLVVGGIGVCKLVRQGVRETVCECIVEVVEGIMSVEIVSMVLHEIQDIGTTFALLETLTAAQAINGGIIVFAMFCVIWGVALLGFLYALYLNYQIDKHSSSVAATPTGGASVNSEDKVAEPTEVSSDFHELREYVRKLLPPIYEAHVPLGDRIKLEITRRHRYLAIFSHLFGYEDRVSLVKIFGVLTIVTVLLGGMAITYDIESPEDDGSCIQHQTAYKCLSRRSVMDSSKSYCTWISETGSPINGQCSYAEPSFGWKETAASAFVVSILMTILNIPVDFCLEILDAPLDGAEATETEPNNVNKEQSKAMIVKASQVAPVLENQTFTSVTPVSGDVIIAGPIGKSEKLKKRRIDHNKSRMLKSQVSENHTSHSLKRMAGMKEDAKVRSAERNVIKAELIRKISQEGSSVAIPPARLRQLVARTQHGKERHDESEDIESNSILTDPLHALLTDISLQACQLKNRGVEDEYHHFRLAWRYGELRRGGDDEIDEKSIEKQDQRGKLHGPEVAMRTALHHIDDVVNEKIEEMRELGSHYALVGEEIMDQFLLDIIGRGTDVARIFENNASSHYESVESYSIWAKCLAFLFVLMINVMCVTFAILKGTLRGKSWQAQYLMGCVLQLTVEMFFFETSVILWSEIVVPQLVFDGVNAAFRDVMRTIDALSADLEAGEAHPSPVNVLNVPDYLFVSTRLAKIFNTHIESCIVARYETIFPSKRLGLALHPLTEHIPHGVTDTFKCVYKALRISMIGSVLLSIVIHLVVMPMPVQEFVISIVQPILYTVVCIVLFLCIGHPWVTALVCFTFVVMIYFIRRYVRNISIRQLDVMEGIKVEEARMAKEEAERSAQLVGKIADGRSTAVPYSQEDSDDHEGDIHASVSDPRISEEEAMAEINKALEAMSVMHQQEEQVTRDLENSMQAVKLKKHKELQEKLQKKSHSYHAMAAAKGYKNSDIVARESEDILREAEESEKRILDNALKKAFEEHVEEHLEQVQQRRRQTENGTHTPELGHPDRMVSAQQRLHDRIERRLKAATDTSTPSAGKSAFFVESAMKSSKHAGLATKYPLLAESCVGSSKKCLGKARVPAALGAANPLAHLGSD